MYWAWKWIPVWCVCRLTLTLKKFFLQRSMTWFVANNKLEYWKREQRNLRWHELVHWSDCHCYQCSERRVKLMCPTVVGGRQSKKNRKSKAELNHSRFVNWTTALAFIVFDANCGLCGHNFCINLIWTVFNGTFYGKYIWFKCFWMALSRHR